METFVATIAHREEQLVSDAGVLLTRPGAEVGDPSEVTLRLRQRHVARLHAVRSSSWVRAETQFRARVGVKVRVRFTLTGEAADTDGRGRAAAVRNRHSTRMRAGTVVQRSVASPCASPGRNA